MWYDFNNESQNFPSDPRISYCFKVLVTKTVYCSVVQLFLLGVRSHIYCLEKGENCFPFFSQGVKTSLRSSNLIVDSSFDAHMPI